MNQEKTKERCDVSQKQVAEIMFLGENTVGNIEKRALQNMKKIFEERGIKFEDLI